MRPPLAFTIHELKPWGGHDRSTLEVVRRISRRWPVDIVSYLLVDPKLSEWGTYRFRKVRPHILRPAIIGLTIFYIMTWLRLWFFPKITGKPRPLIHATGACSLVSDIVQVQFLNAAWAKKQTELEGDIFHKPHSRAGNPLSTFIRRLYRDIISNYNLWVEKITYTPNKTYIAIAQCVADELKEHYGITKNVHIIHHGVDSTLFHPADENDPERLKIRIELGLKSDEVGIAFVGEFERKGLAVSIDAIALLPQELRNKVKLLAIGGSQAEGFRQRARHLGVEENVVFVSLKKEIAPYYRSADLFLMPTLYEPFGLVILEAMASGLPSIVSKIAGGAELIQDGISGKLIQDPTNPQEVAASLKWILEDDSRRKQMAKAARDVALKRSWDQVAKEYETVIEPLLSKQR